MISRYFLCCESNVIGSEKLRSFLTNDSYCLQRSHAHRLEFATTNASSAPQCKGHEHSKVLPLSVLQFGSDLAAEGAMSIVRYCHYPCFNLDRGGAAVAGPVPFAWRAANAPPHNWAQPSGNQPVSSTSRDIDPASSDTACASGALAI
jgi:hypothetical protein